MTIPPRWPHQDAALAFARAHTAAYLAMGMGTGKSRVVVDLCIEEGWWRTLIVCPKAVVPVWPQQFRRFSASPVMVHALGDGPVWRRLAYAKTAWASPHQLAIVVNYAGLIQRDFAKWVEAQAWDALVVDEAHHAKKGVLSNLLARMQKKVPRRISLSGTPMAHRPLDLFGQYRFLDPGIFGRSWVLFRNRYAVMVPGQQWVMRDKNKREIYQNMDEFQRKAGSIMFQVDRSVLSLPEATHNVITVELSARARKAYRELEKKMVAELESGTLSVPSAVVKMLRLHQLTGGTLETDAGTVVHIDDAKETALKEWLEDIGDEPVVVFARFRADLDEIRLACFGADVSCAEYSGRDHEGLADWQAGKAQVLAVQIQAGGEGVDLTRARLCVYYSKDFSLGTYEQSLARVHRPGQTRAVSYYHIVAEDSIDEQLEAALRARKDVVTAVMEGMRR